MKQQKILSQKNISFFFILFLLSVLATCLFAKSETQSEKVSALDTTKWNEDDYNDWYAQKINGKREQRKSYTLNEKNYSVLVDIETNEEVIEGGKDKRSSLDSLQQALFFSHLTDKKPVVVIYDTDNEIGIYEYRIQKACEKAGVEYRRVKVE